ncbi:MAG: neutral/alkaline non-lysosomal ceramidase N-terminal domain-containing protein [Armatimonadota bacterium]
MLAGTCVIDVTPERPVWMDGMIRRQQSTGVHDPLFIRALVLSNNNDLSEAYAVVSVDVGGLLTEDAFVVRQLAAVRTGIPMDNIIVAATHTHSGPATIGYVHPKEDDYVRILVLRAADAIEAAAQHLRPVAVGCASGHEETISRYRRLQANDGHVVMNWESYPKEHITGPLGIIDPEVGVFKVISADHLGTTLCLLFNHAGHPNALSGDNYLLSAEYPGLAVRLLEAEFGGTAIFVNGAQGTMDIDVERDRDWAGMERLGRALAAAVSETTRNIIPSSVAFIYGATTHYTVPARVISDDELQWAEQVLQRTSGQIQAMPDGVGDDYLAKFLHQYHQRNIREIPVMQCCFAIGDSAFVSFPGELYTEIGMHIKEDSPFRHTYIIGLANGQIGYVPTRKAISEGGYAENIREVDEAVEEVVIEQTVSLLEQVYAKIPPAVLQ